MNNDSPLLQALSQDAAHELSDTRDAISARAREIWLEQGCPQGCDQDIWLEAEAEIHAIRHLHRPQ